MSLRTFIEAQRWLTYTNKLRCGRRLINITGAMLLDEEACETHRSFLERQMPAKEGETQDGGGAARAMGVP